MDDGFKDRVDKVFGSISSSSSSWSLTDAQLQRREWNRHETQRDDDRIPVFSSSSSSSSIGLDSTLYYEEEEDASDKMAQGSDRLYMKDVTHHGLFLNAHKNIPLLKQDADVALQGSAEASADGVVSIKSILKRNKTCDEPAKRVRFDPTCKNADAPRSEEGFVPTQASGTRSGVPDYILNPSNYTRYTLDDSSHHGSNNSEAYLELLDQISKHDQKSGGELPKSVVFIPRKKRGDAGCSSEQQVKQSSTQAGSTIGIAAAQGEISETQDDDDDDDAAFTNATSQKSVRQYRSKMEEYNDV